MDKLSQKVLDWWRQGTEGTEYEPIDIAEDEDATGRANDVHEEPVFSWTEYLIFGLLGMAMLWSW